MRGQIYLPASSKVCISSTQANRPDGDIPQSKCQVPEWKKCHWSTESQVSTLVCSVRYGHERGIGSHPTNKASRARPCESYWQLSEEQDHYRLITYPPIYLELWPKITLLPLEVSTPVKNNHNTTRTQWQVECKWLQQLSMVTSVSPTPTYLLWFFDFSLVAFSYFFSSRSRCAFWQ